MRAFVQRSLGAIRSPEFLRFLGGSGAGLIIDLSGFAVLTRIGVAPGVANLCSSFASITVVYLLVTRFAFASGTRISTYIAFVAWYSASIVVFSTAIELVSHGTGTPPLVCKLISVPISFGLNYCFSRRLFGRRGVAAVA